METVLENGKDMKVIFGDGETINIEGAAAGPDGCGCDACCISKDSALFVFPHGWIKVEGDKVTMCPYVDGKKGTKRDIVLGDVHDPYYMQEGANTTLSLSKPSTTVESQGGEAMYSGSKKDLTALVRKLEQRLANVEDRVGADDLVPDTEYEWNGMQITGTDPELD